MPKLTDRKASDLTVYARTKHGFIAKPRQSPGPQPVWKVGAGSFPVPLLLVIHRTNRRVCPPTPPKANEVVGIAQVSYPHESAKREHQANIENRCTSDPAQRGVLVNGPGVGDAAAPCIWAPNRWRGCSAATNASVRRIRELRHCTTVR